jgi:hypothetical protein
LTLRYWRLLAYCARYGKQPLPVLRDMTVRELRDFQAALAAIVEQENGPADSEG